MEEAPRCLLKLEFLIPEEKFVTSVQDAEKTLQQEKQQLQQNQNVKATLQKHKVCSEFERSWNKDLILSANSISYHLVQ